MFERTFNVKYVTSKTCFCYLSDKHSRSLNQGSAAKLSYEGHLAYVSVGGFLTNLKENEIGINSVYGHSLRILEEEPVNFALCDNLPGIKSLNLTPGSKDDFQILELMSEDVQQILLDQIRIVNNNQKIVIWLSDSLRTVVHIDRIQPVAPGRLVEFTEVVLREPIFNDITELKHKPTTSWNVDGFLRYFRSNTASDHPILKKYDKHSVPLVFRLQSVDDVKAQIAHFTEEAYFNVYVQKDDLPANYLKESQSAFLFLLRIIPFTSEHNFSDAVNIQKNIVVRLCPVEKLTTKIKAREGCFVPLYVNNCFFEYYNVATGTKVILEQFDGTTDINAIEIRTNQVNIKEVLQKFKLYLAENCRTGKLLLNSDFLIDIAGDCRVKLRFTPTNIGACFIDSDFVRDCTFTVAECDFPSKNNESRKPNGLNSSFFDVANFGEILDGCMDCLKLNLGKPNGDLQNILVVGKLGTGKTTLANSFADNISSQSSVYVETLSCKNIKGKSLDSLHKLFSNVFPKLVYYQPSALILDDLHVICQRVADGETSTQESIHFNKVSELLADMLEQYLQNNFIFVLATSEATIKLNRHIFSSRGKHLFKNVFTINELGKNDRRAFLNFAFSRKAKLEDVDLDDLAVKTDGFVVQDLVDIVDRCVFESYKEESSTITSRHCENALKNTLTLSLRNVQLHSPGDRDFSDVGGLEDVKRILVECVLWPARYTNIFGKAPLRLQSGLLLYGPPGTGKTILAGAAAKQCDLRLISVKGPELLSKYIGASEQAVRDIFQKAQSAKPCILFFDEFDSLAPRRGHDNTGVTDRVVNQFLTQLDGIEALVGVCVLAATSRPDLLDPALLRPGRLDRQILCPLPDKDTRLAILKALSKPLVFSSDVDLDKIADVTEGYSGADLQGVLYTAQLASVEHLLAENEQLENATEINRNHLAEAVKNTRPSLTREEKLKYERIYARFQGRGDVTDIMAGKQRATLA